MDADAGRSTCSPTWRTAGPASRRRTAARGTGRELFAAFRQLVGAPDEGASVFPRAGAGMTPDEILDLATVIPVVVIDDADEAVPLARALVAGGMPAIEITLRTPAALDAIRRIASDVPGARVGAGTVLNPRQGEKALDSGAEFLVSPGTTLPCSTRRQRAPAPARRRHRVGDPVLERGVTAAKFFPAEASGGPPCAPSPGRSRRSGSARRAGSTRRSPDYLALPNVACVGGSWMLPADALAAGDWARVTTLAAEVAVPAAA